jgi:putative MATE family efflux protein
MKLLLDKYKEKVYNKNLSDYYRRKDIMSNTHTGQTRDMTTGSVFRNIFAFAVPLFISNFFQQCYNVCDTMIASHNLGETALAAIGLTGSVISLCIGFANGMNGGFGILISRSFGARDEEQMKSVVAWTIVLNVVLSILFTIATVSLTGVILVLMKTPDELMQESSQYMRIVLGGIAATLFYNMFSGLLRAVGNSRVPLYFLVFSSILNILMDLLFVKVFHIGVSGIALATVLAQIISSLLCLEHIRKHYRFLLPSRRHFAYQKELILELLSTGFSMGLMNSIFSIGSVILQGAINTLGTSIIAAHTAARRVVMIGNMPLGSISSANATFASQNYGAGKTDRIREGIRKSFFLSFIWAVLFALGILFFARPMIRALTGSNDPVIMENALMNLHINMIFFFPLGMLLILRTTLQGIGHKVLPLISSSLELIFKVIASFVFVPLWGYFGASIAEPLTWLICMIFMLISFLRIMKKELDKQVIHDIIK